MAVFSFSPLPSNTFFNLSANNQSDNNNQVVAIKVTFNEMSFEQSVLHLPLIMSAHQEAAKWISLD